MRKRGKPYQQDRAKRSDQPLPLDDAIQTLRSFHKRKFNQSVELCVRLGIDARQADQTVRGAISLPNGIGKSKRVVAFVPPDRVESARQAGAVQAGAQDLVKRVQDGWTDFDVAVATPDMMRHVGKLGRILGPQGKMPSPKSGTVTADIETTIREYAAGKVEFRNDAGGNVHCLVGRMDFPPDALKTNIQALLSHLRRLKPSVSKGQYVRGVWLSGSMTPSVLVQMD